MTLYSRYGTYETIHKGHNRSPNGSRSHSLVDFSDYHSHGAGVVSILTLSDTLFLTGSYDNCLRSFDYRNMKGPISSINLDGGVWRILLRLNSTSSSFIACCMQSGAQLVSLNQEIGSFESCGTFEPQEDRRLIYGASWYNKDVAALCSFYEKKLYICRIP